MANQLIDESELARRQAAASSPSTNPGGRMDISEALKHLDPNHAGHWTADNLPRVDVVSGMVGRTLTRADISAAAPDFNREAAAQAGQTPPPPTVAHDAPLAADAVKVLRTWLYHPSCPEGQVFTGSDVALRRKGGWVDTPAKLPKASSPPK